MAGEKSLILIDGENVLKSWWAFCKSKNVNHNLDYIKLVHKLSEGTNLLRAIFYDAIPDETFTKKRKFHDALQNNGIQVRCKYLKKRMHICSKCKNKDVREVQKGVDVSLATDILRHSLQGSCDICIVVSGDEDYKDAIECAKERGVKVWVVSFKDCLSSDLRRTADKTIFLDDMVNDIRKSSVGKSKALNN